MRVKIRLTAFQRDVIDGALLMFGYLAMLGAVLVVGYYAVWFVVSMFQGVGQ